MDQLEYASECVENALMAAEVAGGRNGAVLAAEFRRVRDELAELDDQVHSANREIVRQRVEIKRLQRLLAPRPSDLSHGALITDRDELAALHAQHPDSPCWTVAHVGRPCGASCLLYRPPL